MPTSSPVPDADASAVRTAFERIEPLPDDAWDAVSGALEPVHVARGEPLFESGTVVDRLFFLTKGVVRLVAVECERETTLGFAPDGVFLTDLESWLTGAPARMSAIALEDVEAVAVGAATMRSLYERFRVWERLGRRAMEGIVLHKIDKERRIRTQTPEERYRVLQETDSWLLARVPQYHLAAYLGIAPETLSRIRGRS